MEKFTQITSVQDYAPFLAFDFCLFGRRVRMEMYKQMGVSNSLVSGLSGKHPSKVT
jgi:hypothetical protein